MSLLKNFTFTILILIIVTFFLNKILKEMQDTDPNNLIILALSYLWGTRDLQNLATKVSHLEIFLIKFINNK